MYLRDHFHTFQTLGEERIRILCGKGQVWCTDNGLILLDHMGRPTGAYPLTFVDQTAKSMVTKLVCAERHDDTDSDWEIV
mgnify:CR=1 FL=1